MKNLKIETLRNEKDLETLAEIYVDLYNNSVLQENWTKATAKNLLMYFYKQYPDLFLVAYYENVPIAAIMSVIKPWCDGTHLEDTEVFVNRKYQKNGIASELYKEHFNLAIRKYNAKVMEAHTYYDDNRYPLKWYEKLGFEIIDDWKIISGELENILKNL